MTYPNINDNNFQTKIGTKYKLLKKSSKKVSFKELCFPSEYKLQNSQIFAAKFINPDSPYKGVLLYHRIGAGKTCAAIRIGEVWKTKRKIIAVMPASLIGNFYKELMTECADNEYISQKEVELLKKYKRDSDEYTELILRVKERIDKKYKILSYNKFVDLITNKKLTLDDSILMIDEVQNIISETGAYYKVFYNAIHNGPKSLRVVLLSATAINDKPSEIALTLNLLKPSTELPTGNEFNEMFIDKNYNMKNVNLFKDLIKGLISYFPGAPKIAFPKQEIKIVKCHMSKFQFDSYQAVESKEADINFKDILKMPSNFLIGPRIISNIAYPSRLTGESGYNSLKGSVLSQDNIKKYSIKFYNILKKLNKLSGTAYVYSNFKEYGGIDSLIKVLEYNGYKNFYEHGPGKNRYAVWSGEEKAKDKEYARDTFNKYENKDGKLLKVMLLTPAGKEGVSFMRVKQIHVLEPYWNTSRMAQIIGRGVRYCSHKDVPSKDRVVKVYIYHAVAPDGKHHVCVDEYIHKLAMKKELLSNQFYKAIQNMAIDKELFQ